VLFPTIRFALFFAVVLPASWLLMPHRVRWRVFMIAASWFFYAAWDWRFVALLAGSTVVNQVAARRISRAGSEARRRRWLVLALVLNLGTLAWFKYVGFLVDSSYGLLRTIGVDGDPPFVDVVLPVGISFFTFQAISYIVDVYRRKVEPTTLLDFGVYLAFFPQLVAGPIVRASELLPQLRHRRDARRVDASLAFWLIAAGLFKKVVVASYLAEESVDPLFALPHQHGGFEAMLGVYAYAIQIYADFSGYTDIAIGVALLLGFQFPLNFDAPYSATSIQDFWRRWHMTLSRWLRDYVYIPLGGNQGTRGSTYRNLMLTMLLGGLWHGAAWTFVVWGGLHGAMLVAERWWGEERHDPVLDEPAAPPAPTGGSAVPDPDGAVLVDARPTRPAIGSTDGLLGRWGRRIVTFNLICVAWIFFRATSFGNAWDVLGAIVGGADDATAAVNPMVVAVVAAMLAAQLVPRRVVTTLQVGFSRWPIVAQGLALAGVLTCIDVLGPQGVAPFIYFQF
jgi:alginate O-acetyltransferase complex protein AlgI